MALEKNSIAAVQQPPDRYFEDGTALNRVLLLAPYLARCSDDKTATRIKPREYAIRYPYMQVNRPDMVSWLIFDLDHANALAWEDAGLPPPNLVVRNRANGHPHLYYAVAPVCTSDLARDKPILYMKAIYQAYSAKLDADPNYSSGPVAKTPGHPWWHTQEFHSHVYDLGELADYVELEATPWAKGPKLEDASHSRHCLLFEHLRYYAYSVVAGAREQSTYEGFVRMLEAYAHNSNTFQRQGFTENLPQSSLRATVKSVARWTWSKYQGGGSCHRGVMQLDKTLPLVERQRQAARRTHQERHKATESKIRRACHELRLQDKPLALAAIAVLAGVTRQTVATYRHVLTETARPVSVVALPQAKNLSPPAVAGANRRGENGCVGDVKDAVHQVPAAEPAVFDLGIDKPFGDSS